MEAVDDLDRVGEALGGDVPDLFGPVAQHRAAVRTIEAAPHGFAFDTGGERARRFVGIFLRRALDRRRVADRPGVTHGYAVLVACLGAPEGDQLDLARAGRPVGLLAGTSTPANSRSNS